MELPSETQKRLLEELAEWLEFEDSEPVDWLVCGGVALMLQGLQSRTTRDVDVLATWNDQSVEVVCINEFSPTVVRCIQHVIDAHPELEGLDQRWINLGPAKLARDGLPSGYEQRITTIQFGTRLTLRLLGRLDLVALKLYAAADDHGARQPIHLQDLRELRPTRDELDTAVDWIRTLSDFELKRQELKHVARELGYEDLAYYI